MNTVSTKFYSDDVTALVVSLDINPYFWCTSSLSFSQFISHVLVFINGLLACNELNQVVIIATGHNSCDYIFDSSSVSKQSFQNGRIQLLCPTILQRLEEFVDKDEQLSKDDDESRRKIHSSMLSGSLSMALCCILIFYRCTENISFWTAASESSSEFLFESLEILCLQGSPDGPEQYVAIMNAIFSAQRSMVPIDSCFIGEQNSAFLQQASYITNGVYSKPQHLDGMFQYLAQIFGTDLYSRNYVQLPRPVGVDFRASVCISWTLSSRFMDLNYLLRRKSVFGQAQLDTGSASDHKRKTPDS
ncbi:hypothetical protein ACFE04_012568 [Oxalis oulophora]